MLLTSASVSSEENIPVIRDELLYIAFDFEEPALFEAELTDITSTPFAAVQSRHDLLPVLFIGSIFRKLRHE
jgi:hypothetical protein